MSAPKVEGGARTDDDAAMSAPKEIFLSYGRDTEVIFFVKRLKQDLEQNGYAGSS